MRDAASGSAVCTLPEVDERVRGLCAASQHAVQLQARVLKDTDDRHHPLLSHRKVATTRMYLGADRPHDGAMNGQRHSAAASDRDRFTKANYRMPRNFLLRRVYTVKYISILV